MLGGEVDWESVTQKVVNLNFTEGLYGYDAYGISAKTHKMNEDTDLYVSFEEKSTKDRTGKYSIVEDRTFFTQNEAAGRFAGISRSNDTMLAFMGNKKSIFGKAGIVGSFSIEFWINPALCVSGENLFFWRSSRNVKQYSAYQTIDCSFMNGKVEWKLQNVFYDVNDKPYDFLLVSHSNVMPEKWSHHYICYDADAGTLEYYIDGKLEDFKFTTDSGNAYGQYLLLDFGVPARIEICKNYVGSIDEFVISHRVRHYLDTDDGKLSGNADTPYFVSVPFATNMGGCILDSIESIVDIPNQTDLQFFVRGANYLYELDPSASEESKAKWVHVSDGIPESEVVGRFFQVAVNFYSNGIRSVSPTLTQITMNYTEPDLPIPPVLLTAKVSDSKVLLSWNDNNYDGKYGYLVYYGSRSGEFIGTDLDQGDSPIDCKSANSIELTGLENGKIYYFTVASYLKEFPEIIGENSKEIYARPMKELKD